MNNFSMLIIIFGGIGMFLYGMNRMAEGMQKLTGELSRNFLEVLSDNKVKAILTGVFITSMIQSSTGTTIMVVGCVNAGIMSFTQSVGVIMGANIGTTVTAWLVSLSQLGKLEGAFLFACALIGIGAFITILMKKERSKVLAEVIFGGGILFAGIYMIANNIRVHGDLELIHGVLAYLEATPFMAMLIGVVLTIILQSSSVSIGILQCFALNGLVSWKVAVCLIIGQNIGTCVAALISSAGTQINAKRSAWIHLFFNIFGAVVFGIGMMVCFTKYASLGSSTISCLEIAIFHSCFNILTTVMLYPFMHQLAVLATLVRKGDGSEENVDDVMITCRHLDKRILESPSIAVAEVNQEVVHMGEVAYESAKMAFDAIISRDEKKAKIVFEKEDMLDKMTDVISDYLVKISAQSLTEEQHTVITNLFYTVSNFERMGDHAENLAELCKYMVDNEIHFSEPAVKELEALMEIVTNSFVYSIRARRDLSEDSAKRAKQYEDLVDKIEDELRSKHMKRLANELCKPTSGVVYLDILSNLERISDHADNVAGYVLHEI